MSELDSNLLKTNLKLVLTFDKKKEIIPKKQRKKSLGDQLQHLLQGLKT